MKRQQLDIKYDGVMDKP